MRKWVHFVYSLLAELEQLSDHFQHLSALPVTTRSSLLQQITKVMEDRGSISSLQNVVKEVMSQRHFCNVELALGTFVKLAFISGCLSLPQLDQMLLGKRPALGDVTTTHSQKQNIQAILDLLELSGQAESAQADQSTEVLIALHLITSALDGEKAVLYAAFIT